jgi:hypothetical protein
MVASCVYDVLILTETNLTPVINDMELGLIGFDIFRKDRSELTSAKESGGGVLIALKSEYHAKVIDTSVTDVESIFLSVDTASHPIIIGGTYIPPQQSAFVYERFCQSVDEVLLEYPSPSCLLLAGDFNLPEVNWAAEVLVPVGRRSQHLIEMASSFDLAQSNKILNSRNVTLDLLFCSDESLSVLTADDPLIPVEPAHPAVYCEVLVPSCRKKRIEYISYDFLNCDLDKIFNRICHSLGPVMFHMPHAPDNFDKLVGSLRDAVLEFTPLKKIGKSRFPRWFSPELKRAVIMKKIAHRNYKSNPTPMLYEEFRRLRSICKDLSSRCHADYINIVNTNVPKNMKSFWGFINSMKSSSSSTDTFSLGDATETAPEGICNLFARHFSSVFSDYTGPPPHYDFDSSINLSGCVFLEADVEKKLSSLDPHKGAGPDLIPPIVLKHCSALLAPHLTPLFNNLLKLGVFPDSLKTSFVVPIFKSGDRGNVKNFRPVVIQPTLGKVFESLVLDHITFTFKSIMNTRQHGFSRGRSIATNLTLYEHYIHSSFRLGKQVDSIYIDFSKAFDKVSHQHLLAKLQAYGILGSLLRWFGSYLADRWLLVRMFGATSRPFLASSGVPQGSHLGPFLFSIFLNDIVNCIEVDCLMFADDIKVFTRISTASDFNALQSSLVNIEDWCHFNCMEMNPSKCNVITFHRSAEPTIFDYMLHGSLLKRVESIRDLGINLTFNLNPTDHINNIIGRAVRNLGFLIRTSRSGLSIDAMNAVYKALMRSV